MKNEMVWNSFIRPSLFCFLFAYFASLYFCMHWRKTLWKSFESNKKRRKKIYFDKASFSTLSEEKKISTYFIYFTGILEKDSKSTNVKGIIEQVIRKIISGKLIWFWVAAINYKLFILDFSCLAVPLDHLPR